MTSTISLRPLAVDDACEMVLVLSDPSLYEFTGGEPPTLSELEARYRVQARGHSSDNAETWFNWIVEADSRPVGYVQATVPADGDATEISWVIGRPWQGRGYARGATILLLEELRRRGVTAVVAHIHTDHAASRRIAAGLGMHPTDIVVDGETRWMGHL